MAVLISIFACPAYSQESIRLTDVIKSNGTGNIDLFKDVTANQLEQFRVDNDNTIILAVDVNEDSSGTEKATSQAVSLGNFRPGKRLLFFRDPITSG